MNDTMKFNAGDFVWAKLKGYSTWPGQIFEPTDVLLKIRKTENSYCVYFYGSHNYCWIDNKNVYSFLDCKDRDALLKAGKPKALFEKAVEEIERVIESSAPAAGITLKFNSLGI